MVIGTQHTIASNGTTSTDYECVGGCAMNRTMESKNETYLTYHNNATLENATTTKNLTVCGPNVTDTFGQNQTLCNASSTEVGNSTEAATGQNTADMTGQNVTNSTETPLSSTTEDEGGDGNGNESPINTTTETIKTTLETTTPSIWTTTIETTPDPIAEACSNDVDKDI